jgi:hypothetical protein
VQDQVDAAHDRLEFDGEQPLVAGGVLFQVLRAGPITWYRIEGAVTVYLLAAYAWALAYQLVALSDPVAFNFPADALHPQNLRFRLLYFSTTTLTAVSYGRMAAAYPSAGSAFTRASWSGWVSSR